MSRRNIRSHNKQTFALIKRLSLNTNDLEFKIIENFLRNYIFIEKILIFGIVGEERGMRKKWWNEDKLRHVSF